MNLFESESLQQLLIAAFITTFIVVALSVTFDKFFDELPEHTYRVKLLVFSISILVTLITIEFDIVNWQKFATRILITIAFAVLFYHYVGGKFIKLVFVKVKKMLPGNSEDKSGENQ